jgi:glycogen debranching enzyme
MAVPSISDSAFAETARWSKAVLFANRHYIDGRIVPMPAPAEYNFYFTHDALVTDLGAVMFDTDRVRDDLRFLRSLSQGDSLLPHAYYWRDGAFRTEFARADNWNHHWFLILTASYLKHSGDSATIAELLPIMDKSVELILQHEHDGLMYSIQPDWWDVGNVYGARAYSTILTARALDAFTYVSRRLGERDLSEIVRLSMRLRSRLSEAFWDEEAGYLLNMIDSTTVDRHYYAGSLLAAAFDLLDDDKKNRLLETAGRELLDERIGMRNVMPADFQGLIDVYRFQGMEAGEAYVYLNGGVWPQNIAWYALGLISADRPDEAREVVSRYLTLEGIRNSPLGQPSFFEYRNANPESLDYGEIDKPTFLWAGGWFLHVLYSLAGVREDAWNVWLDTRFPSGWSEVSYDLMVEGAVTRVEWKGAGPAFHAIRWDGRPAYSAVLTEPVGRVELERGLPQEPYLARATAVVGEVTYEGGSLSVILQGEPQQHAAIEVVSMTRPVRVEVDSTAVSGVQVSREESGVITLRIPIVFHATTAGVDLEFEEPLQRD